MSKSAKLGKTYAAETGFLIERDPDTVRGADVAFVRSGTSCAAITNPKKYIPFAPDLAVEVLSPNDRAERGRGESAGVAGGRLHGGLGRSIPATKTSPFIDGERAVLLTEDHEIRWRRRPPRLPLPGRPSSLPELLSFTI